MKKLLPLFLISVILIAGCTSSGIDAVVKALPSVNSFLQQYPNAKITTNLVDENTVIAQLIDIKKDCPDLPVSSYYKTVVDDGAGTKMTVWVDSETKKAVCAVIEKSGEKSAIDPQSKEISVSATSASTSASSSTATSIAAATTTSSAIATTFQPTTTTKPTTNLNFDFSSGSIDNSLWKITSSDISTKSGNVECHSSSSTYQTLQTIKTFTGPMEFGALIQKNSGTDSGWVKVAIADSNSNFDSGQNGGQIFFDVDGRFSSHIKVSGKNSEYAFSKYYSLNKFYWFVIKWNDDGTLTFKIENEDHSLLKSLTSTQKIPLSTALKFNPIEVIKQNSETVCKLKSGYVRDVSVAASTTTTAKSTTATTTSGATTTTSGGVTTTSSYCSSNNCAACSNYNSCRTFVTCNWDSTANICSTTTTTSAAATTSSSTTTTSSNSATQLFALGTQTKKNGLTINIATNATGVRTAKYFYYGGTISNQFYLLEPKFREELYDSGVLIQTFVYNGTHGYNYFPNNNTANCRNAIYEPTCKYSFQVGPDMAADSQITGSTTYNGIASTTMSDPRGGSGIFRTDNGAAFELILPSFTLGGTTIPSIKTTLTNHVYGAIDSSKFVLPAGVVKG